MPTLLPHLAGPATGDAVGITTKSVPIFLQYASPSKQPSGAQHNAHRVGARSQILCPKHVSPATQRNAGPGGIVTALIAAGT
jgi:hypothetical protein